MEKTNLGLTSKKITSLTFIFLIFLSLFNFSAKAQCFYMESILVDACNGSPCPGTAQEGENEMVLIKVGGTALNIAYGTTTAAVLTPTWPNNPFKGWQTPGALTNPLVSALNATIIKCGYLKEPVGGVLPANSQVLIITSTNMCTAGNSFANLTDTLYVIFQIAGNTAGHFANNDNTSTVTSTPTGSVSPRTMTIAYTGVPSCSESVIYDRSLLVNDLGTYGGSSAQNDGSTVQYNSSGVATYVNNGCQAPYIPIDVTASAPTNICSNATPTITGVVSGPATTYSWTTNGSGSLSVGTGTLSSTGSTTINTTYTPGGGESGTITFTLTAHGKCSLAVVTNTVAIAINPAPSPTITSSNGTSICNGGSTVLTASGPGTYTYTWNPGSHSGSSYTVSPSSTQIYTVAVTNTCGTTNANFTVNVNPTPIFSLTSNSYTLCNGSSQTFTVSGANTYTWTPAATLTNPNTANPTASPTATTVYSVTGTSSLSCTNSTPATVTVTVNPLPTYSLVSNTYTICNGNSQGLVVSGASTYTWTPTTTLTGANTSNPTATPSTTTIYSVTGTSAAGCSNPTPATVTVIVNPKPTYSLTGNAYTICNGGSQTFTVSGASTYTWTPSTTLTNPNTANPTASPTTTTVYSVTGTTAAGCSNLTPATVTVTVSPIPTLTLSANSYTICNGSSQTFTVGGVSNYSWTPASTLTGANTANPTATPTTTTIYTVNATASGCAPSSPLTLTLTVNPLPTYSLVSNSYTVCDGSSQTINVSGASTYTWSPSSTLTGANTANPTATPTATTVYSVTGTSSVGCSNLTPATVTVTVNPKPTYSLTGNAYTICNGGSQTFTVSGASTYTWTPSSSLTNANTSNPTASPTTTTVYSVTGTSAVGCGNLTPATVTVTVSPVPVLSLAANSYTICNGSTQTFTVSGGSTYTWTPAASLSGASTANPVASPSTTTIYTVGGTASGCAPSSPLTLTLTVNPLPTYSLSASSYTICNGATKTFTVSGASTYTWTPSSSLTNANTANPTSSATSTTVYSVTGTSAAGCGNLIPATVTLTVNPTPTYSLVANSYSICSGASQTFTVSGANTYSWTPAATLTGANTANPTATPVTTTVYSVTGTSTAGCGNVTPATVTVNVTATPTLSISGTKVICSGNSTVLTGATATNYTWMPGTIYTNTISVSPTANTTYTLTGANGTCTSSAVATVTVNALPTISVAPSTTAICSGGGSSTLTASGAGATGTYTWTPSTTLSSPTGSVVIATPTNTTIPTVYTVTGTNANNCVDNTIVSITVNQTPTITVTGGGGNAQTVCAGGLTNTMVNGITFSVTPAGSVNWTNSNTAIGLPASSSGNIASYPAPTTLTVQTVGTITATAVASGSGCPSTSSTDLIYTITINPIPGVATPTITPASCGVNDGTIIGATGTGGSTYQYSWNGGPFTSASSYTNGAGTYPLEIKDVTTGCIFSKNYTLPNAGAPPPPTVTASSAAICVGATATLTVNSPVAGTTYSWTPAVGSPGTGTTFTVNVPSSSPNPFTIDVTSTASNCTGSAGTTSITVNQLPTPSISNSTSQICNLTSTTLTVTPNTGGYSYQWGNGSGIITGAIKDTLTVSTAGNYSVLVTNTVTGCQAVASANGTITVNSLPVIDTTGVHVVQSNCTSPTGAISNVTYTVNGTGVYVWTDNSTGIVVGGNTPTLSNVPAGNYCVQVTDANTCVKKFCYITINNAGAPAQPVLTASLQDTIYCNGTGPKTLTVTVTNTGTVTPTVNWYDASNNPLISNSNTYTPTGLPVGTTTLYVTATASGCASISKPVTITVLATPAAPTLSGSISNPLVECQGVTPATLSVTASASVTPVWYVGTSTVNMGQTYTPSTATPSTTIYVVSDSSTVTGCTSASAGNVLTVTVTINAAPAPPTLSGSATNPLVECQGVNPAGTLSVTTSASVTPVWYVGTSTVNVGSSYTPSTATAGTTVYTISDSSTVTGCTNNSAGNALTVTVTINAAPAPPTLSGSVSNPLVECQGVSPATTLSVSTTASVTPVWYVGTSTVNVGPSYTPSTATAGTTVYTISDSSTVTGCTNNSAGNALTVTVTINAAPAAPVLSGSATNPLIECKGTSGGTILVTPTGTVASIPVWYNGTTHVTTGNSYTPPTNIAGTTVYTISDSATVANGCSSASNGGVITVTVTINPTPTIDLSTATTATAQCGQPTGGVAGITPADVSGGTPQYHYQWYNAGAPIAGDTTATLSNVNSGNYTLIVTDANGCVATPASAATSTTFTVPASTALVATFTTNPNPATGTIPLHVIFTNTSNVPTGSHYVWSFGDGTGDTTLNTTHTYTAVGTYTASLLIQNGACGSLPSSVTILAEIPTTLVIPNIFSPNGDGVNDEFFIINTGLSSLNCDIFNRWGQLLKTLTAPDQSWDGITPNGDKAPEGTYMYILQAQGLDGKTYKQQGTLMLVR